MGIETALLLAAVGSAVYLMGGQSRPYAAAAAVIAGIQACLSLGWASLSIRGISLTSFTAIALCVCGALLFGNATTKTRVAASTVVCMTGGSLLLAAMGLI